MRKCLLVLGVVACSSPAVPAKSPSSPPVQSAEAPAKPPAPEPIQAFPPPPGPPAHGVSPPKPTLRLPRNFLPTNYAATLAIDPSRDGFDGSITITGDFSERSSVIWLHQRGLTIKRAGVKGTGVEVPLAVTVHDDDELLELRADGALEPGMWQIAIEYSGKYDTVSSTGAFKQIVNGVPYVYTQFEALYARRVFPCFDEPERKVPWHLTLDVPAKLVAVSNTPVMREQPLDGGQKRLAFAATRPLPTYLVAFGVGPFDLVDAGKTKSGTPVRMVVMKGRGGQVGWAAKTTPKIIDLLEEFFGSKYPYSKLDMMAIPVTTGFGAMENAGLVTFTETLMMLDPRHGSREREYTWVVVAAHELAHQWFGNLVTTAWWDDIWLNEGFASWAERKISARFEPAWHEELAEVATRNQALDADSLISARQIRQPIARADDILNAFDGITYRKGASVLNMFEAYLGRDMFLRGVRDYLAQHAYGNATSNHFTAAISKAASKDVSTAFATFLEQPGAPEITATLVCDRGAPHVDLSQRRYVPPGAPTPPATRPWRVPVCVAFDRDGKRGEACAMLDAATGSLALDAPACPRWVMPNQGGRGYYRTAYTEPQVTALRDQAWPQLAPSERQALFDDVANAATVGKLPLALALSFVPKQLELGDRFSIEAALAIPQDLRRFVPEELRPNYEAWLRKTFGPAARKAGWLPRPSDSLDVESARVGLIYAVANLGHDPALTAEAVNLAGHWRDLPQSTRDAALAVAAHARPAVFDKLFRELFTERDRDRRDALVAALGSSPDVKQQAQALGLVLDPRIDVRDTQFVFFAARDEANRVAAQQYFKDHQDEILHRIPADGTSSGQAWLSGVFTSSCAAERRDEIADYVTKTFARMPGGERTVRQSIEAMDQCIARRKLLEPEIRSWLAAEKPAAGGPGH